MNTYIKISNSSGEGFVEEFVHALAFLEAMLEACRETGEAETFAITPVQMSDAEFDALPKFSGFLAHGQLVN